MAIQTMRVRFAGISPLLHNNAQGANPRAKKTIAFKDATTKNKSKPTDDNFQALAEAEVNMRLYWDEKIGVYVPSRWVHESIARKACEVLGKKVGSKEKVRSAIFMVDDKLQLDYDGKNKVKKESDIYMNDAFVRVIIVKGSATGSRKPQHYPCFHEWSFVASIEFDTEFFTEQSIMDILNYTSKYTGFGDFRPTYGRAIAEVVND